MFSSVFKMNFCPFIPLLALIFTTHPTNAAIGMAQLQRLMADKTIPTIVNGSALDLHLGLYIESVGNFRSQEMTFDVDLYMYTSWKDPKMKHNSVDEIVLINERKARDLMWMPDLYFANAHHCKFQDVTVPNFNIFIARDGLISYSLRATCSISCSLDLVNYPMDRQHCFIRVVSYGHTTDRLNVRWFTRKPIRKSNDIRLPEFSIEKIEPNYCNATYRYTITEHSHRKGNFSCLLASIFLERSLGYNLVQSYIPTGLIVMISWVSFFIDRRAVPARVTLSFTTLVSLTTLGNGLRYDLPQVSYAKALDLWYGACLMFVFLSLIEFAAVNSYMRKCEKFAVLARQLNRRNERKANIIVTNSTSAQIFPETLNGSAKCFKERDILMENSEDLRHKLPVINFTQMSVQASHSALRIDKRSRVVFPVAFVVFNLCYWSYYQSRP